MTHHPIPGVSVLGICGAARAGKDELAKALIRQVPGAERLAFSDPMAAVARVCHGMTKRHPETLQHLAMLYRDQRPGVWVDAVYGAIQDRRPPLAIVTGLRFPGDAQLVRDLGGPIVRVVRVCAHGDEPAPDRDPSHRAEAEEADIVADCEIALCSGQVDRFAHAAALLADWLAQRTS